MDEKELKIKTREEILEIYKEQAQDLYLQKEIWERTKDLDKAKKIYDKVKVKKNDN